MKDIGSIFPIYDSQLRESEGMKSPFLADGRANLSLCREALWIVAKSLSGTGRRVLVPAYTCRTVFDPFVELGWEVSFFPVGKDLRIDGPALAASCKAFNPDLLVVHPYFGMDLNEDETASLESAKRAGIRIAVDLTQCIMSRQRLDFVDFYVGSYRKWTSMVDGAFLETKLDIGLGEMDFPTYDDFVWMQEDAMYLRGNYFETGNDALKQISRRLNALAVSSARKGILPHRMADISYYVLEREDWKFNEERRKSNFKCLFDAFTGSVKYIPVCSSLADVTTAPLYFSIYLEDRARVQKVLAENHIYAPVIWPAASDSLMVDDDVRYIYSHILSLPCDQRYDEKDMDRIISIMKSIDRI